MRTDKEIKAAKSYLPKDLLQFGIDHLRAAKYLYKIDPSFYDSAGHLSYLGIELLLKAWLLHCQGKHPKIHGLITLWGKITSSSFTQLLLQKEDMEWMQQLDRHYDLRYPSYYHSIETGSDDWSKTEKLFSELCLMMPMSLQKQIQKSSACVKGNRVLMRKPKK